MTDVVYNETDRASLVDGRFPKGYRVADYMNNPYYRPSLWGLESVGEIELWPPCWSFDTLAVLKGDEGYYIGTDSGCSCPTPFEWYHSMADFTGPLTAEQCARECVDVWMSEAGLQDDPYRPCDVEELVGGIVGGDSDAFRSLRDEIRDFVRRMERAAEKADEE